MKKLFTTTALVAFTLSFAILSSCSKEDGNELAPTANAGKQFVSFKTEAELCGQTTVVNFLAGQHTNIGNITVGNDADSIYVTYNTTGPWRMRQLHLYVGKCDKMPVNKSGNPVPGQFPFKKGFGSYSATTYTFSFAKSAFDTCFCVAAHAEVAHANGSNAETGWAQGTRFVSKGNWGMYFSACKQQCTPPDPCAPKENEGCSQTPDYVLNPNSPGFLNGTVTVGGETYSGNEAADIYTQNFYNSDAYYGFTLLAALKVSSNTVAPDASVQCQIAIVDSWLATLGKLNVENINYTAPANVQDAIAAIQAWLASNGC